MIKFDKLMSLAGQFSLVEMIFHNNKWFYPLFCFDELKDYKSSLETSLET